MYNRHAQSCIKYARIGTFTNGTSYFTHHADHFFPVRKEILEKQETHHAAFILNIDFA